MNHVEVVYEAGFCLPRLIVKEEVQEEEDVTADEVLALKVFLLSDSTFSFVIRRRSTVPLLVIEHSLLELQTYLRVVV